MLLIPEGYHKLQGHLRSLVRMPRLGKKAGNFAWSCKEEEKFLMIFSSLFTSHIQIKLHKSLALKITIKVSSIS